jgi:hypothetical protein
VLDWHEDSGQYLRYWKEDGSRPPFSWPAGWVPSRNAFRSGIDLATAELNTDDVAKLAAWNEKVYGVKPKHVELFARLAQEIYKAQRIRYERAMGDTLPAQLAPLFTTASSHHSAAA